MNYIPAKSKKSLVSNRPKGMTQKQARLFIAVADRLLDLGVPTDFLSHPKVSSHIMAGGLLAVYDHPDKSHTLELL